MINIIKNNIDFKSFIVLKITKYRVLIFKIFNNYTKCIYINQINNHIEINVDKVFDNKLKYKNIDRVLISKQNFINITDSLSYIQNSIDKNLYK